MPEILEVEAYRRLAERVVGRTITLVEAPDAWFLKGGATPRGLADALAGRRITGTGRHGKVLLLESGGPTLGLRFGMTGRLLVCLLYTSPSSRDKRQSRMPSSA